jgi:hypothetical protein
MSHKNEMGPIRVNEPDPQTTGKIEVMIACRM